MLKSADSDVKKIRVKKLATCNSDKGPHRYLKDAIFLNGSSQGSVSKSTKNEVADVI